MLSGKIEGVVDFTGLPEVVKQHSQLPGDTDYSSLFSVLPSSFGQLQAPAAQVAIGSKRPENVLCGGDQQSAKEGITGLGNVELGVVIAGLISARDKPQRRTDLPAPAEAIGLFKGEDEGQGSEWSHAADTTEEFGLRVAFAAKLFVLSVIGYDLLGEGSDGVDDRRQSRSKGLGDVRGDFVSEAVCCARWQTRSRGFDDVAGMVDE